MKRDGQGAERQGQNGDRRLNRSVDLDFFLSRFDGEGRRVIVTG